MIKATFAGFNSLGRRDGWPTAITWKSPRKGREYSTFGRPTQGQLETLPARAAGGGGRTHAAAIGNAVAEPGRYALRSEFAPQRGDPRRVSDRFDSMCGARLDADDQKERAQVISFVFCASLAASRAQACAKRSGRRAAQSSESLMAAGACRAIFPRQIEQGMLPGNFRVHQAQFVGYVR